MSRVDVKGAAERLDEARPGWAKRVSLRLLRDTDEWDYTHILGQIFGCYADGLKALKIDSERAGWLGFAPGPDLTEPGSSAALHRAWVAEIRARGGPRR